MIIERFFKIKRKIYIGNHRKDHRKKVITSTENEFSLCRSSVNTECDTIRFQNRRNIRDEHFFCYSQEKKKTNKISRKTVNFQSFIFKIFKFNFFRSSINSPRLYLTFKRNWRKLAFFKFVRANNKIGSGSVRYPKIHIRSTCEILWARQECRNEMRADIIKRERE